MYWLEGGKLWRAMLDVLLSRHVCVDDLIAGRHGYSLCLRCQDVLDAIKILRDFLEVPTVVVY